MARLDDHLAALGTMQRVRLKQEWERVHKEPAPNLSADLLRLGIAYRLQEKVRGDLSRAAVIQLQDGRGGRPAIKPGTRFVRSWHGRTVSVEAQKEGFVFEDRVYPSLSAIARKVTGTNWSGPRFFGLRGKAASGK